MTNDQCSMIDTHIHVVRPQLPGVGPLSPLLERPGEEVASALRQEMKEAGLTHALAMGAADTAEDDPLGVHSTLAIARSVPGLRVIGVANPFRSDPDHISRVAKVLAGGQVVALKAYLGY